MNRLTSGRLGNRLFQLNLVLQLSIVSEVSPVFPNFWGRLPIRPRLSVGTGLLEEGVSVSLERELFETGSLDQVREKLASLRGSGQDIALGGWSSRASHYVHFTTVDPANLFEVGRFPSLTRSSRRPDDVTSLARKSKIKVALHYRGTDFESWDSSALMGAGYYLRALESLQAQYPFSRIEAFGVSDDSTAETPRLLQRSGITFRPRSSSSQDFLRLQQADVIVASPSTFSFWASILGSKRIIFDSTWVRRNANRSAFWEAIERDTVPFVRVDCV